MLNFCLPYSTFILAPVRQNSSISMQSFNQHYTPSLPFWPTRTLVQKSCCTTVTNKIISVQSSLPVSYTPWTFPYSNNTPGSVIVLSRKPRKRFIMGRSHDLCIWQMHQQLCVVQEAKWITVLTVSTTSLFGKDTLAKYLPGHWDRIPTTQVLGKKWFRVSQRLLHFSRLDLYNAQEKIVAITTHVVIG